MKLKTRVWPSRWGFKWQSIEGRGRAGKRSGKSEQIEGEFSSFNRD